MLGITSHSFPLSISIRLKASPLPSPLNSAKREAPPAPPWPPLPKSMIISVFSLPLTEPLTIRKQEKPLLSFSPQQIVDQILEKGKERPVVLLAPLSHADPARLKKEGFLRVRQKTEIVELQADSTQSSIELVVDRITLAPSARGRLTDSVELALRLGQGKVRVVFTNPDFSKVLPQPELSFSTEPHDPDTGTTIPRLTPRHFSFNSPEGACPNCSGLGTSLSPDVEKIIPNTALPIEKGAIAPWNRAHPKMRTFYRTLGREFTQHAKIPALTPLMSWPEKWKKIFLHGSQGRPLFKKKPWEGLIPELSRQLGEAKSDSARHRLQRFFSTGICTLCSGTRLQPSSLSVTLASPSGETHSIASLCQLTASDALHWLTHLKPASGPLAHSFAPLQTALTQRLSFLEQLGLGYLTLDRTMDTLSGGEYRRTRLATQIGGGLTGVLYVLDEPSIGLHPSEHSRLLNLLFQLRDLGNSLIVVEHDEETLRRADYLIEFGPGAGTAGGQITGQGTPKEISALPQSLTELFSLVDVKSNPYKKKLLHRLASLKRSCHSQLKESGLLNSLRCIHMRDRRKRVRQKLPRL